jgi:hypothetical protein
MNGKTFPGSLMPLIGFAAQVLASADRHRVLCQTLISYSGSASLVMLGVHGRLARSLALHESLETEEELHLSSQMILSRRQGKHGIDTQVALCPIGALPRCVTLAHRGVSA